MFSPEEKLHQLGKYMYLNIDAMDNKERSKMQSFEVWIKRAEREYQAISNPFFNSTGWVGYTEGYVTTQDVVK